MPSVSLFRPTVTRKTVIERDGQKVIERRREKSKNWWMKWRRPDGKVVKRKTKSTDKSVARQIAREVERKLALDPYGLSNPTKEFENLLWTDFVAEFLRHVRSVSRPQTAVAYGHSLDAFTRVVQPRLLRNVATRSLQDFAAGRMNEVAAATVNKDLRALRAALRWARGRKYIHDAPDFAGSFVREDVRDPVVIPEADISAMLAALELPNLQLTQRPAAWWRVYLQLALYTGMRRGEALGLTWDRVNFETGDVTVHRLTSKGRRDRTYPGAHDLVRLLRDWWEAQEPKPSPQDPVLPWTDASLRQMYVDWHRIQHAAGIPDDRRYVPKNCRSTCATQLLESGEPTLVVKDWLGHSSVQTTERYYASTREARRKAAGRRRVVQ